MSERAVILAGGKGARLRPYTLVLPKPLMPIGEYPILEVLVRQLVAQGVGRITLAIGHQANLVRAFFGDGSAWGAEIDYSLETQPLSTIGPLRLIPDLPERFLLLNGDVLTDRPFAALLAEHARVGAPFTVSAARRRHTIDYGVLQVGAAGALTGFTEKPAVDYLVSMGVYAVSRSVLARVPPDTAYGFDHLMTDLLRAGETVHVSVWDGYWMDIGRPDDYVQAIEDFEQRRRQLLPHA
jgi:NDP-sugar pyrophosphorylase family protein